MKLQQLKAAISNIRWEADQAAEEALSILRELTRGDGSLIRLLSDAMLSDPTLLGQAEDNPTLSKLTLYEDNATGAKLRFHKFAVGSDAWPHNHRWDFGTIIISGGYEHEFFVETEASDAEKRMNLAYRQDLRPGDAYFLRTSLFHRTSVTRPTLSIILRGPTVASRWQRVGESQTQTFETTGRDASGGQRELSYTETQALLLEMFQALDRFRISNGG